MFLVGSVPLGIFTDRSVPPATASMPQREQDAEGQSFPVAQASVLTDPGKEPARPLFSFGFLFAVL